MRAGTRKLREEDRLDGLLVAPDAAGLFDALRSLPLLTFLPSDDGARDIWTNEVDAIGSVANYFRRHGWRAGEPVALRVDGAAADVLANESLKPKRTVA